MDFLENRDLVLFTFIFICSSYVWAHVGIYSLCVSAVKTVALKTLSYIVDENQLDLLRLGFEMLQFFLSKVQGALADGTTVHAQCMASEMIRGLSNLAKNDFNKRLMVAQGKYCTSVRRDIQSPRIRPVIDVFRFFVF